MQITLKDYDYDKKKETIEGGVSTYQLGRSMTLENMAELMSDYLNSGMKDYREGEQVGLLMCKQHRTIQGSIIRFCLGIIIGLSKQEYTDARNEAPVNAAKQIAELVKTDALKMGYMI